MTNGSDVLDSKLRHLHDLLVEAIPYLPAPLSSDLVSTEHDLLMVAGLVKDDMKQMGQYMKHATGAFPVVQSD